MDSDLDEVDAFNSNREKIFLDGAGEYGQENEVSDFSDEEVMEINENEDGDDDEQNDVSDDDDALLDDEGAPEDEENDHGWGGRQDYYGGEDDDANDEMAEEARRQQKKHLEELAMDDYVDDDMMEDWKKVATTEEEQQKVSINANVGGSLDSLTPEEQRKLLLQSYPEFVPLLQEMVKLQPTLVTVERLQSRSGVAKATALRAYLGCLSSYFALFMEKLRSNEVFSMKDEPIMENILGCREIWRQANELAENNEDEKEFSTEISPNSPQISQISPNSPQSSPDSPQVSPDSSSGSDSESDFVDAHEHLPLRIDINSRRNLAPSQSAANDDFTEITDAVDMEDKQRRKRTLRFYTSKIDQAAAKANHERFTGDIDVPYKERLYERQQRLLEEARKRGLEKKDLGEELDEQEFGSGDEATAREVNAKDDEFYENVAQEKKTKRAARKMAHEEAVAAAKAGKLQELQESMGEDGKRAINYQILKNRGLTPHKKKDNRNTRVKKRKKYEQAKKKLKSVRQVYEGSSGPYEGEKTGIKKGLSRSVKLV
ncbi:something about silencing protein 10 [Meyerozyma guilliermondii]